MASTVIASYTTVSYSTAGTNYVPGAGFTSVSLTEANCRVYLPKSGTIRRLRVVMGTNAATAATMTVLARLNGADTALSLTFPPGVTGALTNDVTDVAVAAGDILTFKLVRTAGGGAHSFRLIQVDYEVNDSIHTAIHVFSGISTSITTASASYYTSLTHVARGLIDGWKTSITTTDSVPDKLYSAGTFTSIRATTFLNTFNVDTVITLQKNGADTGLTVTIPANSGSGAWRSTGSVSVAPGDTFGWRRDTAGRTSGNLQLGRLEAVFESSDGAWDMLAHRIQDADPSNNSVFDGFLQFPIYPIPWSAPDVSQVRLPESGMITNLRTRVYSSGAPNPWPQTLHLNGGDTSLVVTIPSGTTTGSFWRENTSDEVNIGPDALITLHQIVENAGSLPTYRGPYTTGITIRPASVPEVVVETTPGDVVITGNPPTLWVDQFISTAPGELTITGNVPILAGNETVDAAPGALEVEGKAPGLFLGIAVNPAPGELILEAGAPEVIIYTESSAISSQQAVLVAGAMVPDTNVSQVAVLVAGYEIPPVAVSQQVILIMADAHPCVSRLCQVWLLQRRDGEVFAFTSHDEPVKFMGHTFTPCASLNPSAVEAASDMAAVGNMELTGIIDAEGITEFDLYAGKFDDCRVDVWEIPWAGAFPHPIRLASGTTGSVSHGRDGFKGEVLGPGAKMQQQAITQVVTAACRFTFGDARCAKDIGPLTESASVAAVAASAPFRTFRADALIGSGPEGYFSRGVVTWTSGANIGVRSEVKEYDPATGTVVLWNLLPSPAVAGDTFTISPGCTLAKDGPMGCVYWGNLINFGGFPDVPGDDATAETPIAKV